MDYILEIKRQRNNLLNHGYKEYEIKTKVFMNQEEYFAIKNELVEWHEMSPLKSGLTIGNYPVEIIKGESYIITGITDI